MSGGRVAGRGRTAGWLVLAVVVAVALALGASRGGAAPTPAQRSASIDAMVRCPSCQDISVADSSASTALAIRQAVAQRVRAGQSDAQIESFLVSRYGPAILLRPPARGITAWVWILPPLVLLAAGVGVVTVFWRRRAASVSAVSADDRALVERALADRTIVEGAHREAAVRT